MTIADTIQSLEVKLARALKAKRRHKRRAEVYRHALARIAGVPAVTHQDDTAEIALEAISEGDRTK